MKVRSGWITADSFENTSAKSENLAGTMTSLVSSKAIRAFQAGSILAREKLRELRTLFLPGPVSLRIVPVDDLHPFGSWQRLGGVV